MKHLWAHCFINFKFTVGIIATSQVEVMNACLKCLMYNSDVSLCDLIFHIQQLLDNQEKWHEYDLWHSFISLKHRIQANFLFSKVNYCVEQFLTPNMLKMQHDEINYSVYYAAKLIDQYDTLNLNEKNEDQKEEDKKIKVGR